MILVQVVGTAGLVMILTILLNRWSLGDWEQTATEHWTERARRFFPIQSSAQLNLFLGAINAGLLGYWTARVGPAGVVLFGLAGLVGGLAGNYFINRRIEPRWTPRRYSVAVARGWGILLLIAGAFFTAHSMIGAAFDSRAVLVVAIFLAANVWFVTAGAYQLLRFLGALRRAEPHLESLVQSEADRLGIRVKEVSILDDLRPLAFAMPIGRRVFLTDSLCRELSPLELRSVVVHELGHLTEPGPILAGRILGQLLLVPLLLMKPLAVASSGWAIPLLLTTFVGLICGSKLLSRRMERRADQLASLGSDRSVAYAAALEKIYSLNLLPASGIARGRAHPDLYDRMIGAGIQPDYPRPKAPEAANWTVLVWGGLCLIQSVPAIREYLIR